MKVFITRASDGCGVPGGPILAFSGLGSRSRQNGSQEVRFKHFLALAPEVDKMSHRKSDLNIFWPWLQKSAKAETRGQRPETRDSRAESREQRAESKGPMTAKITREQ